MELILHKGRPITKERRLDKEVRCYDLLDSLGIEYERVDHEPAMTIEACAAVDEVLGDATICKNLFLCNRQKTHFYLLAMSGEKQFVTKDISKQIGSPRLSFADEAHMEEFLDITPGSVSVLGLMNDHENHVQLLVDKEVAGSEYVGCHPCVNTSSLKIKTKDLMAKFLPYTKHECMVVELPWEV